MDIGYYLFCMDLNHYTSFANVIDLLLDAICVVDKEGRFVFVSAASEQIFGYTPKEMAGKAMIEMVVPEDRERTLQAAREIMSGEPKLNFENRYIRKDGQVVYILWSARWSEADQLRVAVARNITGRKRAESMQAALYAISEAAHAAEDIQALFRQIHHIIGDLLPATNFYVAIQDDTDGPLNFPYFADTTAGSSVLEKLTARTLCQEVIRSGQPLLLCPDQPSTLPETLTVASGTMTTSWLGVPLISQKGAIGALILKSYAGGVRYTENDKELLQFVSTQIATAVERKRLYARLQQMAQYDFLTGLPNRGLLYDRIEMALARARRERGRISLLYLDLDKFKQVNDSLGHVSGDHLLQEVANRLKHCVRDPDTVARIGGDEFVVLLEKVHLPEEASLVAEKIRSAIGEPVVIDGCALQVAPSIGIAHYPEHGAEVRQLLKHADDAMYAAKREQWRSLSSEHS